MQFCAEDCELLILRDGQFETVDRKDAEQRSRDMFRIPQGTKSHHRWGDAPANLTRVIGDQKLDNPFALSPSRRHAASAIAPRLDFDEYAPKRALALLDTASGAIIWRQPLDGFLDSVTWSPDGATVAALISAPAIDPRRGATDAVAGAFGWRVAHSRAWVEVYATSGERVCRFDLYADLKTPVNYVRWEGQ